METSDQNTATKPRARWLRYSLRTLLLLITALCIWLGLQVNAAREQREAIEAILKAGGKVCFDYQFVKPFDGNPRTYASYIHSPPSGPAWLRQYLGDDYFRTAVGVCFLHRTQTIAKSDLAQLAKLPRLEFFILEGNSMLSTIEGASMQRVLESSPIQNGDLDVLAHLSRLRALELTYVPVDGSVLALLQNPKCITYLSLNCTIVDDDAMEQIGKMIMLKELWLDGTRITDAGLAHMQNLTNLKLLSLVGTSITDAGLQHLTGLKKLIDLDVRNTRVTDDGFQALRRTLPQLNSSWWFR